MKKVCVVTSTRADYGLLKPLLQKLSASSSFQLEIVATGMHLSEGFGNTYKEIDSDGFKISKRIEILTASDSSIGMSKTMGLAQIGFADYFGENKPDLLVVLGDRYEIMAVAAAASAFKIPIAHIHGGELTAGAIDDAYRHSITKMSLLHFTSCEEYRHRVIQLGESPNRVFNVGALGVENILLEPLMNVEELSESINFSLCSGKYFSVTFHPVTMEGDTGENQVKELLKALSNFKEYKFVISKANSDAGGRKINVIIDEYAKNKDNVFVIASLGMKRYLSLLKYSAGIIGNSSSGIIEGPASKIPTVNIGNRQKGRIQAKSVINCMPVENEIKKAINLALGKDFQTLSKNVTNPYGYGSTSNKITEKINWFFDGEISLQKEFYDIDFEV